MKFYEALNIRREEINPVSLLIFQSVFLGVFLGAFDVGANTLFLKVFDETMISKAFAVSGLIGIVMTSIYSFAQSKITFSRLAAINLLIVFLFTFLLRAGYYFSDTKWLAFALFVMMGPLNIVALVGFWGTVSRIFDLRQGKRVFGIIDMGQVFGVIVCSWAIPFLVVKGFQINNLLYISAVSIFLSVILQIYINIKYKVQLQTVAQKTEVKSNFMDTFKNPYIRTMALFVIFSMLVAFFIHYLFLSVAQTRFTNPDELAKFLGGLMGTLTFVSILIKTFVFGTIMKNYGLKVSLLISPVIMLMLVVGAALVGSFFGFTLESATFTFFFLLISLGKLFQKALKDSIESPSLKMLYQSLDPSVRFEVQARIDGTINELAAFSSGILLMAIGFVSYFKLIHYTYFLLGIIIIWGIITFYLYKGYRKTLQYTLIKTVRKDSKHKRGHDTSLPKSLNQSILENQLQVISKSKPWLIISFIKSKLREVDEKNTIIYLLKTIRELSVFELLPEIEKLNDKFNDAEIVEEIKITIDFFKQLKDNSTKLEKIKELIASKNFEDRILAAKILGLSFNSDVKNNLTFLLRDMVPAVKKQAIRAAKGSRSKELISFLIDFLDKDMYAPLAHASLIDSGETGLEMLEQAYNRSQASDRFRERILKIIPETGSSIATTVLFSKLSLRSNHAHVILDGLLKLDFKADEKERLNLHQKLVEQAGICAWNLNAFHLCPPESEIPYLKDELDKNYHKSIQDLFSLLKLLYDKNSIEAVWENLEAGTGQSISFAIELLDTFVEEDLKPYMVPLIEDIGITNKLWILENYFPLRKLNNIDLLNSIINRDNNLISKQAKIYALNAFYFIEDKDVTVDLVAQLFNTDRVMRQLSAQIIEGIDRSKYLECRKRMFDKHRVELDKLISQFETTGISIIERINFYKSLFNGKAESTDIMYLLYNSTIIKTNTNLFDIELIKGKHHILFLEKGSLNLLDKDGSIKEYHSGQFINTSEINQLESRLEPVSESIVHCLELDKVLSSIYDQDYLLKYLVNNSAND